MAEPYFQFKKFRVYHSAGGFKVGTDGVLLGAWAPVKNGDKVLDIGTGTGLISLMLAQRAAIAVDAVEINPVAAEQAKRNVERSPFSNIKVINTDIAQYVEEKHSYDLVVCNPPFFSNAQAPKDKLLHLAKHTVSLKPADLFRYVAHLLTDDGRFAVIFPKTEYEIFCSAAKAHDFYPQEVLDIFPQPDYPEIRLMVNFTKTELPKPDRRDFCIARSNERHDYTAEYKELTKDFFLRF